MYCIYLKIVRHEFVPILGDVKDLQWDFLGFVALNPRAGLLGVSALWTFRT